MNVEREDLRRKIQEQENLRSLKSLELEKFQEEHYVKKSPMALSDKYSRVGDSNEPPRIVESQYRKIAWNSPVDLICHDETIDLGKSSSNFESPRSFNFDFDIQVKKRRLEQLKQESNV